jgi:hypothetical protein
MLLFLTWNTAFSGRERLAALGLPGDDVRFFHASQEAVPPYLWAGDAAFLLRENLTTNLVASPTKMGEALLAGLPIVHTAHVGDLPVIAAAGDVGYCMDADGELDLDAFRRWCERLVAGREAFARRCVAVGTEHFGSTDSRRHRALLDAVIEHGR